MRQAVTFLVVMVLVGGAHVVAAPGRGHVTLNGDVSASFDIEVNGCVATRPGDSVVDGFMFTIVHNEMIASGVIQVPGYGGDKTYERTPANDRAVRLSLQIHKSARDSKVYDVDVREKSPGIVKATVSEDGRTGSATFEDVDLGSYGKKEGKVSGSITWECASVLVL
jgi:hypothetical protein